MYDHDIERAVNFLLSHQVLDHDAEHFRRDAVRTVPSQMTSNPLHLRFEAMSTTHLRSNDQEAFLPPRQPVCHFPDIDNGDCVYYCLYQILNELSPSTTRSARTTMAAHMRNYVNDYIESQWSEQSSVACMAWSDLITLSHNTAVTAEERETYGAWGGLSAERQTAWLNERDGMYGGIPEITAFVEILASHEVNLQVRIWRECDGELVLSTSVQGASSASRSLVADFHHSGEMDTNMAHMRLISSNSFVYTPPPPRRPSADQDPDYEPVKKRVRKV